MEKDISITFDPVDGFWQSKSHFWEVFHGKSNSEFTIYHCRSFHKRYLEHMNDMRNPARDGTTLSGHIWYLKGLQVPYTIKWEIAGRAQPFNPATGQCRLCLLEKYYIMFNKDGASLNQRTEFFSHCYHKAPLLLSKQKFT